MAFFGSLLKQWPNGEAGSNVYDLSCLSTKTLTNFVLKKVEDLYATKNVVDASAAFLSQNRDHPVSVVLHGLTP